MVERVAGNADIVPGGFTYEEQSIAVAAASKVTGYFRLRFEGKETANITYDETRESFKYKLEALGTISVASVTRLVTDRDRGLFAWHVRFSYLRHETLLGAGNVGLFLVSASHLQGNRAQVLVTQTIKGTQPLRLDIGGLEPGTPTYVRVSAQNKMGFGPASAAAVAVPRGQPAPPASPALSVSGGSSLTAQWSPPSSDGGAGVTQYAVEWYSAPGTPEVQAITTSADQGMVEVQTLEVAADTEGIDGYFKLSFRGETTDNIWWDAPATGAGSVKAKLERLSTIGTVGVTRDLSRNVVPGLRVDAWEKSDNITASSASLVDPARAGLQRNDLLFVAGVAARVRDVSADGKTVFLGRVTNFRVAKKFNEGDGAKNVPVEKWANGYRWQITFSSHVGDQPLIAPSPSDNWSGTNPTIHVSETSKGLQPIAGTYRVGFRGHRTGPLAHDAPAEDVEAALEALHTIGDVKVSRHLNGFGYNWLVTFLSELGPQPLVSVHGGSLSGPSAAVYAARETGGVLPEDYCAPAGAPALVSGADTEFAIHGLTNGLPYYVTVRAGNAEGFGRQEPTAPARAAPVSAPGAPTLVQLLPLSDLSLKLVWALPAESGGLNITSFRVEWDTTAGFDSIATSGYTADVNPADPAFADCGGLFFFNIPVTHASAWMPRFARVRAYNNFAWGPDALPSGPAAAAMRAPGLVQQPSLRATSSVGLLVEWAPPSAMLAQYGGDGGSAVVEYLVEYDTSEHFDSPATEVVVRATGKARQELLVGGRDLMTGEESTALEPGVAYHVRISAMNGVGYGPAAVTAPSALEPVNQLPSRASQGPLKTLDETTLESFFGVPERDGGVKLSSYRVEFDDSPDFGDVNGTTREPRGGYVDVPIVREVQSVELNASTLVAEEQWLVATVEVTNERQTVRTNVTGVDEVQMITIMADEVRDTVMTLTTTASDFNEEQTIMIDATDLDEVQALRTETKAVLETQLLTVSATRRSEVQQITILMQGDTSNSAAVTALENALGGEYQLTFDSRSCEWCAQQSSRTTASIAAPFTATRLNSTLSALANIGGGGVEVERALEVVAVHATEGLLKLKFNVTFRGDGVRGDVEELRLATNQLTNTSKFVFVQDLQVDTLVQGNQPAGSFYLTYHCESRVEPVQLFASQGSPVVTLSNLTGNVSAGQVLRINTGSHQPYLGPQSGGASYEYFQVTAAAMGKAGDFKATLTLDRPFADAGGQFQGDVGVFYSNASDPYGLSSLLPPPAPLFSTTPTSRA